jgi:hypothetical protein
MGLLSYAKLPMLSQIEAVRISSILYDIFDSIILNLGASGALVLATAYIQ